MPSSEEPRVVFERKTNFENGTLEIIQALSDGTLKVITLEKSSRVGFAKSVYQALPPVAKRNIEDFTPNVEAEDWDTKTYAIVALVAIIFCLLVLFFCLLKRCHRHRKGAVHSVVNYFGTEGQQVPCPRKSDNSIRQVKPVNLMTGSETSEDAEQPAPKLRWGKISVLILLFLTFWGCQMWYFTRFSSASLVSCCTTFMVAGVFSFGTVFSPIFRAIEMRFLLSLVQLHGRVVVVTLWAWVLVTSAYKNGFEGLQRVINCYSSEVAIFSAIRLPSTSFASKILFINNASETFHFLILIPLAALFVRALVSVVLQEYRGENSKIKRSREFSKLIGEYFQQGAFFIYGLALAATAAAYFQESVIETFIEDVKFKSSCMDGMNFSMRGLVLFVIFLVVNIMLGYTDASLSRLESKVNEKCLKSELLPTFSENVIFKSGGFRELLSNIPTPLYSRSKGKKVDSGDVEVEERRYAESQVVSSTMGLELGKLRVSKQNETSSPSKGSANTVESSLDKARVDKQGRLSCGKTQLRRIIEEPCRSDLAMEVTNSHNEPQFKLPFDSFKQRTIQNRPYSSSDSSGDEFNDEDFK